MKRVANSTRQRLTHIRTYVYVRRKNRIVGGRRLLGGNVTQERKENTSRPYSYTRPTVLDSENFPRVIEPLD